MAASTFIQLGLRLAAGGARCWIHAAGQGYATYRGTASPTLLRDLCLELGTVKTPHAVTGVSFVSHGALKPAVFQHGLAQPFGLIGIHAVLLGAPLVEACIKKAARTPDFLDLYTGFGLPQKFNDLLIPVFARSHVYHFPVDGLVGKMNGTIYGRQVNTK